MFTVGRKIEKGNSGVPGAPRIARTTVNAWDEKRFVDAVKATGRNNLIITGFH